MSVSRKRKAFGSELKAKVALVAVRGLKTMNELAGEHGRRMARPTSSSAGLQRLVAEGRIWLRQLEIVLGVARKEEENQRDGERPQAVQSAIALMKHMQKSLRDAVVLLSPKSN